MDFARAALKTSDPVPLLTDLASRQLLRAEVLDGLAELLEALVRSDLGLAPDPQLPGVHLIRALQRLGPWYEASRGLEELAQNFAR